MGLLKAGIGAVGGVLADQWIDYFYCDSLEADVLAAKGQKRTSSKGRSSNTKGEDNIISNGSTIAVNEGQCMIIVEQGEIVEICATPGEYKYDSSTEPSIFTGDLVESVKQSFAQLCKRFTYGGDTGKNQRIYYFNTKEIVGNKYGTSTPVPFRVVDQNAGIDLDISVRCNGEYSYKLTDPILFYKNVCGNVEDTYTRDKIDSQLKSELLGALQPAFARISEMGVRYSAVPGHTTEVANALNEVLSAKWSQMRGITIASFGVNSISASEEDEELIKNLQTASALNRAGTTNSYMAVQTGSAMNAAASNTSGAMTGFMGMGMAGGMGANAAGAFGGQAAQPQANAYPVAADGGFGAGAAAMNSMQQNAGVAGENQTQQMQAQIEEQRAAAAAAAATAAASAAGWDCSCGTHNTGKFCSNCGSPAPQKWTCSCGSENEGNFCSNCGAKKPE
jgi:membrane protease subunit (stomatin/prohibitin family)